MAQHHGAKVQSDSFYTVITILDLVVFSLKQQIFFIAIRHIRIKHQHKISLCFTAGPNTFDSPSMVAEAMAGSLAGVMDVLTPESKKKGVHNFMRNLFLMNTTY